MTHIHSYSPSIEKCVRKRILRSFFLQGIHILKIFELESDKGNAHATFIPFDIASKV